MNEVPMDEGVAVICDDKRTSIRDANKGAHSEQCEIFTRHDIAFNCAAHLKYNTALYFYLATDELAARIHGKFCTRMRIGLCLRCDS